jgi:hypothetical protein
MLAALFMAPTLTFGQSEEKVRQADIVKGAIGRIAALRKPKAEIVLRDLREFKGTIIGVYPDHFLVKRKEKKNAGFTITIGPRRNPGRPVRIKYSDVLQLEGKDVLMSWVPDPREAPFGDWQDLRSVMIGEFLQLEIDSGKKTTGVFLRATGDSVTLMRGDRQVSIERDQIVRVYRITGDTSSLSSKLLRGGTKGTEVVEDIFPIADPSAHAHPIALGIGAAIGALIYILPKSGPTRVLAYAR